MATETAPQQASSPAVSLFQKAHGRMTTLQRIDEQLSGLIEQRRKIQDELRTIQSLINEEFDRITAQSGVLPARLLSQIADTARDNGHSHQSPGNHGAPGNGLGHRAELSEDIS